MGTDYGWSGQEKAHEDLKHDWVVLRQNIQDYIKGINFGYKKKLKEIGVDFIDAKATFKDKHTVSFNYGSGADQKHELKGKSFVIATGVRPRQYESFPELK